MGEPDHLDLVELVHADQPAGIPSVGACLAAEARGVSGVFERELFRGKDFLAVKYHLDEARIHAFSEEIDLEEVAAYLNTWDLIAQGVPEGGKIAELDTANRFRWLTNTRSTIIQPSKAHVGRCEHPGGVLEDLFQKYVV